MVVDGGNWCESGDGVTLDTMVVVNGDTDKSRCWVQKNVSYKEVLSSPIPTPPHPTPWLTPTWRGDSPDGETQ
jgi:hypothetical protein